jgi:hypothetical protein
MKLRLVAVLAVGSIAQAQGIPTWAVEPVPVLSVGREGVRAEEFSRVQSAFRLSGSRLAVANGATNEIRIFDSTGRFIQAFGRTGSGPGEFRSLRVVGHSGDTVFVFDDRARRITSILLARDVRLLGTMLATASGNRGSYFVSGRLSGGRWLVQTHATPGWNGPPEVHRLPTSIGSISPAANGDVVWLGEFQGLAIFIHNPTGNVRDALVGLIAFSPSFFAAASGGMVWFGDSESAQVTAHDARSGARRSIDLPFPRRSPPSAVVDAERQRGLAAARDSRSESWTRAKYSAQRLPRSLPSFSALIPGPDGEIWIQEYTTVRSESARHLVIDAKGSTRAWVRMPAGDRILDAATDHVVCVHEDDDGIESVRLYGLRRK